MTQPIDVAYVEVVARTQKLEKQIKNLIEDEIDDLGKAVDKTTKKIEKDFDDTAKNIDKSFKNMAQSVKSSVSNVGSSVTSTFTTMRLGISRTFRRARDSVDGFFKNSYRDIDTFLNRVPWIQKGFNSIVDGLVSAGSGVAGFFSLISNNISLMGIAIGALIIALPGLIGMLAGLGAVLANISALVSLLPAGLSVLAAIIAPIVIGFKGFGEAMGAILEGDPKKIAEAMKNLAPAAQIVAREFGALQPRWESLQNSVQEALFEPLVGDLTRIAVLLLPLMDQGLTAIAQQIGGIISDFAALITTNEGMETLNAIFATTADIVKTFRIAFNSTFGSTLLKLIQATLPVLSQLSDKFIFFLDAIAGKLGKAIDDGSFQKFLESAVVSLEKLMQLGGAAFEALGAFFTPTTLAAGQQILDVFTQLFTIIANFLATQEGQQFLEDVATNAVFLAQAISGIIIILSILLRIWSAWMAIILDFFGLADRTVVKVKDIGNGVKNMAGEIVNVVTELPNQLMALGGMFLNAGKFLIMSFVNGFKQAGSFIDDVAGSILGGIKTGLNKMIGAVNAGIAGLDALLPFSLSRIPSLAQGAVAKATPGGTIAQIGEGTQDEAIVPLDDFWRKLNDRGDDGGMTVNFGPDSININFSGVVPTEQEARRTGEAVGDGIAAALERRDVRTLARAQ